MEIVTEPDLSNGMGAAAFVKKLQLILERINTCNCKMEGTGYRSLQVYQRSNSQSDTEFCRTSLLKLSDKCPTKLSDKILPGRSESLHSQIVKL